MRARVTCEVYIGDLPFRLSAGKIHARNMPAGAGPRGTRRLWHIEPGGREITGAAGIEAGKSR
jgi:hypothetical protein